MDRAPCRTKSQDSGTLLFVAAGMCVCLEYMDINNKKNEKKSWIESFTVYCGTCVSLCLFYPYIYGVSWWRHEQRIILCTHDSSIHTVFILLSIIQYTVQYTLIKFCWSPLFFSFTFGPFRFWCMLHSCMDECFNYAIVYCGLTQRKYY